MTIWFEQILLHTRAQPQTPAMVMEDRVITYGMLEGAIENCARRAMHLRAAAEAPVAVVIADPIRHVTVCLALMRAGIASISLEPAQFSLATIPLAGVLGDAAAKSLTGNGAERFIEVTDEWFSPRGSDPALAAGFPDPQKVCRLSLTSGSTGEPKLLRFTVDDIGARKEGLLQLPWTRLLNLPGLSSAWGYWTACATLAAGATLFFSTSPFQSIRMIELFAIDYVMAATEQLVALIRAARTSRARLSSLRLIEVAGAVPSHALLEAATRHLCKDVYCRYGASEAGAIARAHAADVLSKPGLVGQVLPTVEVAVVDAQGNPCAAETPGRIMVRPRQTEGAADPFLDLGDIGWMNVKGELYVRGRTTDSDVATPFNGVSPALEAEHLLRLAWDADDAGAILVQGGSGTRPQIWIGTVNCPAADAGELEALMRSRGFECDVRIWPLPAIPRGVSGKINRAQLRSALLAAQQGGSG